MCSLFLVLLYFVIFSNCVIIIGRCFRVSYKYCWREVFLLCRTLVTHNGFRYYRIIFHNITGTFSATWVWDLLKGFSFKSDFYLLQYHNTFARIIYDSWLSRSTIKLCILIDYFTNFARRVTFFTSFCISFHLKGIPFCRFQMNDTVVADELKNTLGLFLPFHRHRFKLFKPSTVKPKSTLETHRD